MRINIKALFIPMTIIPFLGVCQNTNPTKFKPSIEIIKDDSVLLDKMNNTQNEDNNDSIILNYDYDYQSCFKYPGDDSALLNYIKKEFKYPDNTLDSRIEGKVYTSFTINEKGEISNIKIKKGLNNNIDKEIVRIISKMPNWIWICKEQYNRPKLVKCLLPISIRLKED
jgi:hypothetical protein